MTDHAKPLGRPVRLGLIGCGGIVRGAHAPAFLALQDFVSVTALTDVVPENREALGHTLNVPPSHQYQDYRDMLAQEELDAVSIATPHHLHAEQVIAAAERGVAVISEKPMATTLEAADAILSAVRRHDVPYTVVHNLLFSAPMQEALTQVREGRLGRPIFGRAQMLALKPADFAISPSTPGQLWRAKRAAGGGCLIDSAYHEIYSVEALMASPIKRVEARVTTLMFDIDVDDIAILLFEHENGALSTVQASWCAPSPEGGRWCEVHGTSGSLRVHYRTKDPLLGFARGSGWRPVEVPVPDQKVKESGWVGHAAFFAKTFSALVSGTDLPVGGEQARHNLAIIEAARQATAKRGAVDVVA